MKKFKNKQKFESKDIKKYQTPVPKGFILHKSQLVINEVYMVKSATWKPILYLGVDESYYTFQGGKSYIVQGGSISLSSDIFHKVLLINDNITHLNLENEIEKRRLKKCTCPKLIKLFKVKGIG